MEAVKTSSLRRLENFYCPGEQGICASNNGNVRSQKLTVGGTLLSSTAYGYDDVNRLTNATATGTLSWAQTYGYGGQLGNLSISGSGEGTSLRCSSYDAATNRCNAAGFGSDAAGNLTTFQTRTLGYDAENRQVSLTDNGTVYTYFYDGDGRRVRKAAGGVTSTVYVYDAFGKLAAEYATGTTVTMTPEFLTVDHLGSTPGAAGNGRGRRGEEPI